MVTNTFYTTGYDAVVVGAGHAGCEAALALARTGIKTLILSLNLDSVAFMACNPSVGGTAKGQLVREIDALGGEMGVNADKTALQMRMLNVGKGAAVQSLRAQSDKHAYHMRMKQTLENTGNLCIRQGEAAEVLVRNGKVCGVRTAVGEVIEARAVVLATGVYLKSEVIAGEYKQSRICSIWGLRCAASRRAPPPAWTVGPSIFPNARYRRASGTSTPFRTCRTGCRRGRSPAI